MKSLRFNFVFCEIVDINVLVFTQYYGKGKITVRFLSSFEGQNGQR